MARQLSIGLPFSPPPDAYDYGKRSSGETHGVVLTKAHIVDLILDLVGYRVEYVSSAATLLDPSCGDGTFLISAIERFFAAHPGRGNEFNLLEQRFLAFDIDPARVDQTRSSVLKKLVNIGIALPVAKKLSQSWVCCGDFLLERIDREFDFVVGNPPYIRIEQLATVLQSEYRNRYSTLFDRADLYVAFIERALDLLSPDGCLGFICADRWILNKYGAPLRQKITSEHGIRHYVDLHHASPFESDVVAYPGIFSIGAKTTQSVRVARLQTADSAECRRIGLALLSEIVPADESAVHEYSSWFRGQDPWILGSPRHLETLRDLERRFSPLEVDGETRIGIGVATGNDKLYIVDQLMDIEPDRLLPLVMREDINLGEIVSTGRCVINTFEDGAGTVDLTRFPKLERYLLTHAAVIKERHIAQKNPGNWFRTIDRVYPELVSKPKLLIPDIAGANEVVFDEGHFYPHHNLYYIVSSTWDLEVLGGLLSSRVALFFIWSYAVKMRGGYLRFQAQYLRRIRVPKMSSLSPSLRKKLKTAFRNRDFKKLDALALEAWNISELPEFNFVDTRER